MELQGRRDALAAQGLGVAAISFDSPEVLAAFAARAGITYPLLSDADSAVIRAFGILNTVAAAGLGPDKDDPAVAAAVARHVSVFGASPMVVGTPFPGTFIVDRGGRVTARFFEPFYRERTTAASILLRLGVDTASESAIRSETPHLSIAASLTNTAVSAGSRFSLILDIEPQPGIHVYAPGADELGYRVITLRLDEDPRVRIEEPAYPASEIYHFVPLDERVPVYQRPFRLVQDVVIGASSEAIEALGGVDTLPLGGRLEYQACDDTICFDPVAVPLSWTLTVLPLDRQPVLSTHQ